MIAAENAAAALPLSWHALPEHLRKPFWSVNEAIVATSLSRATINRLWTDPNSGFPRKKKIGGKVCVPSVATLRYMERED